MSLRAWAAVLCCWAILLACGPALGQANPPLVTDDTGTPGPNKWEIDVGATNEEVQRAHIYEAPIFDINYGIGKHVELTYEVPVMVRATHGTVPAAGIGDSIIACKWRFLDQKKYGVDVSTYPQFSFNTGRAAVYRRLVEPGKQLYLPVSVAHDFGFMKINGEIGYNVLFSGADEWAGGISGAVPLRKRVTLLGEAYFTTSKTFSLTRSLADAGATVKVNDVVSVLGALGHAVQNNEPDLPSNFGYLGLQFNF